MCVWRFPDVCPRMGFRVANRCKRVCVCVRLTPKCSLSRICTFWMPTPLLFFFFWNHAHACFSWWSHGHIAVVLLKCSQHMCGAFFVLKKWRTCLLLDDDLSRQPHCVQCIYIYIYIYIYISTNVHRRFEKWWSHGKHCCAQCMSFFHELF